jgi:hypothetical protein
MVLWAVSSKGRTEAAADISQGLENIAAGVHFQSKNCKKM